MKPIVLYLGLAASFVHANIIFNHVPLKCDENNGKIYHGCLRGQECNNNGDCVVAETVRYPPSFHPRSHKLRLREVYSPDGRCGPAYGNTICSSDSKVYNGGCCSYGWCGNTDSHCGSGCLSGCQVSSSQPTAAGPVPRADGLCGKQFGGATCDPKGGYGTCCSGYGYCGTSPEHCLQVNGCQSGCLNVDEPTKPVKQPPNAPTSTTAEPKIAPATMPLGALATAKVTTDGSCGGGNDNTVCGDWPAGNCCSLYGYCGKTSAHCGAGCQSGDCVGPPVIPAPGPSPAPVNPAGTGQFIIVGDSGVPAMHAALMPNGRVIFLDKLENFSHLKLANGRFAMSSEYDPQTNMVVPLSYLTNAFCAGGTFLADGRVVSLGGNGPLEWLDPTVQDGFNAIRYLSRSSSDASLNGQSWNEPGHKLSSNRWYPSAQTMPDGTIFVASGSLNGLDPTLMTNNNPTYEILNADGIPRGRNFPMEILVKNQPYYMYPFIHLLRDGNLFVFTSKASQVFDVGANKIVKELPDLTGDYRTYPNTGGSVLLPLTSAKNYEPEIIVCGGGAYQDISSPTDASCGRIQPLDPNAHWEMDSMPEGRGMVEGTLLPDGSVLWLNGGNRGAQGFGLMAKPTLQALLYTPDKPKGQRWTTLATSTIPRLYHSVAVLLLDGTVMVTGSNPVEMPKEVADQKDPYPTDFRVEIFVPPYRQGGINKFKPSRVWISDKTIRPGGVSFRVTFSAAKGSKAIKVVLHHGGFITHSVHMGQRMVELDVKDWIPGGEIQNLEVSSPPNNSVTPPGPYVLFVVVDGNPSDGQFVQVA